MLASRPAVISVIVPLRNEQACVAERFRPFADREDCELIVADDGKSLETAGVFDALGARRLPFPGTRGLRLARAAKEARGEILFFVHADSRPPDDALALIRETLSAGASAGAFSLEYEEPDRVLRWIAWWANRRSRWLGLPFGDQGLFCRREEYERAGGFRDLPICDDLDLVLRLRRLGKVVVRPERTTTSARRYREAGALRQMLRSWRVQLGYLAGVSPDVLARWYNPDLPSDGPDR